MKLLLLCLLLLLIFYLGWNRKAPVELIISELISNETEGVNVKELRDNIYKNLSVRDGKSDQNYIIYMTQPVGGRNLGDLNKIEKLTDKGYKVIVLILIVSTTVIDTSPLDDISHSNVQIGYVWGEPNNLTDTAKKNLAELGKKLTSYPN